MYGEYRWVAPLRYIHALEHGAIAFMYHPCAPPDQVDQLRKIASSCLWKRLFFAFKEGLDREYPMAVISYGHIMKINHINKWNPDDIKQWIRNHAKKGANDEGIFYPFEFVYQMKNFLT